VKLIVTILEPTFAAALKAIRNIDAPHDGIELRAEALADVDMRTLRAATTKTIVLTHRGKAADERTVRAAVKAGIDLVDVEWPPSFDLTPYREHVVLSHHDFEGMPDLDALLREMKALHCAQVKVAVTPSTFAENEEVLRHASAGVTLIGMGERGLYSRILAPFLGSELVFVAVRDAAAPGQLTLDRALDIYDTSGSAPPAEAPAIFAIAGNPAGHSLSPVIHNKLFREKRANAAYTIASVASFAELEQPFLLGTPRGLSVTAPFKEDAYRFAARIGAELGENARACEAANTLVNLFGRIVADNTDVDGFTSILAQLCGRDRKSVAIVGAGGTARAALVAVQRAGMHVTVFNRSPRPFPVKVEPLEDVARFDGEIIIDTLPVAIELPKRATTTVIQARYGSGAELDGLDLLHAQAARQHELFMKALQ
jgi:3-dehydroquinate dehydratase type I